MFDAVTRKENTQQKQVNSDFLKSCSLLSTFPATPTRGGGGTAEAAAAADGGEEEEKEEGLLKATAMNEVEA